MKKKRDPLAIPKIIRYICPVEGNKIRMKSAVWTALYFALMIGAVVCLSAVGEPWCLSVAKVLLYAATGSLFALATAAVYNDIRESSSASGTVSWVIKKGRFRPSWAYPLVMPRLCLVTKWFRRSRSFCFTASCFDGTDHVNKLWGYALWTGVHRDSVRFGWTAASQRVVNVMAYWYDSGVRHQGFIRQVNCDEFHKYQIKRVKGGYLLSVYKDQDTVKIGAFLVPLDKGGVAARCFIYYDDALGQPAKKNMLVIGSK